MPTENQRLNIVLEASLYAEVKRLAKKDHVSLSLKAGDLIRDALEFYEDTYWADIAGTRSKTFTKKAALTHKQVWAKRIGDRKEVYGKILSRINWPTQ